MQDLLDEKEFIEEKLYNPWPFFFLCYAVASCFCLIEFLIVYSLPETDYNVLVGNHLVLLFILSVVMLFRKRKIILLPTQILAEGLLGLLGTNYLFGVAARLLTHFIGMRPGLTVMELIYKAGAHFVAFLVLCAIFLPIVSRRRKKILRFGQ